MYFQFEFKIIENEMKLMWCLGLQSGWKFGAEWTLLYFGVLPVLGSLTHPVTTNFMVGYHQRSLIAGEGMKYLHALVEDVSTSTHSWDFVWHLHCV